METTIVMIIIRIMTIENNNKTKPNEKNIYL